MVSEAVKQSILEDLVEPCFYKDIKSLMSERTIWRKSGSVFETLSKLFVGAASILSFATGLNFWSGTSSVLSLVCMQFSSFSYSESKERSSKMNKLLDKLKVQNVPDISAVSMPMGSYTSSQQAPYSASYGSPYDPRSPYGGAHPYGQPYYYEVAPPPSPATLRRYSIEYETKKNEELEKLKQLRASELERQEALKTALQAPTPRTTPHTPRTSLTHSELPALQLEEVKIDVADP
jgi:hypothetical protein